MRVKVKRILGGIFLVLFLTLFGIFYYLDKQFFIPTQVFVKEKGFNSRITSLHTYIIEDLHRDKDCQGKIYSIVSNLCGIYDEVYILMEGVPDSELPNNLFAFLRSISPSRFKKGVLSLLSNEKIDGRTALFLLLSNRKRIFFRGIENRTFYLAENKLAGYLARCLTGKKQILLSLPRRYFLNWYLFYSFDMPIAMLYKLSFLREANFKKQLLNLLQDIVYGKSPATENNGRGDRLSVDMDLLSKRFHKVRFDRKKKALIIICGGFHSSVFSDVMRKLSLPYVVFVPKIWDVSSPSFLAPPSIFWEKDYSWIWFKVWKELCNYTLENKSISQHFRNLIYPIRFPSFLWGKIREKLRNYDESLYYIIRGRGFSWTDVLGKVHFLDEFLENHYGAEEGRSVSAIVWAIFADAVGQMYGKRGRISGDFKLLEDVILLHEGLHSILKVNSSFRKDMFKFIRQVLKPKFNRYISWILALYGQPSSMHNLSPRQIEEWVMEEFSVNIVQEYVFRGEDCVSEYLSFLVENGIELIDDFDDMKDRLSKILSYLISDDSPLLTVIKRRNRNVFSSDVVRDVSISSKKLSRLLEILEEKYSSLKVPYLNVSVYDIGQLVFLKVSTYKPRSFLLKTAALVRFIPKDKEIRSVLSDCGYSEKEIQKVIFLLKAAKDMCYFNFPLAEVAPFPYEHYLQDINDFFLQLSERDSLVSILYLCSFLVIEKILDGQKGQKKPYWCNIDKLKYLCLPLAERIGEKGLFYELKEVLVRRSFPLDYFWISGKMKEVLGGRTESHLLERLYSRIYEVIPDLNDNGYTLVGRLKSIGSLVEKMHRRNYRNPFELSDVLGLMLVVPDGTDLNAIAQKIKALDIFHSIEVKPVPNTGKPKHWCYVVSGVIDGINVELQIRTQSLHEFWEKEYDAHWFYNLMKTVPDEWKGQLYSKDWGEETDPVFLLIWDVSPKIFSALREKGVFVTLFNVEERQTYSKKSYKKRRQRKVGISFVRANKLSDVLEVGLGRDMRLYGYSVFDVFANGVDKVKARLEVDLDYFKGKKAKERLVHMPNLVYIVSDKDSWQVDILRFMNELKEQMKGNE